jgi:hypothetical protein
MLHGPLHNAGADGRCEACREPFPCPTSLASFEAVKRELEQPMNQTYVACVFDHCQADAAYTLIVRWPDGQLWQRDVCRVHERDGVEALQRSRDPAAGEPTITRRVLTHPN